MVENVITPGVLNIISSPATGATPPTQFEPFVQFNPVPVPPFHVFVAAEIVTEIIIASVKRKRLLRLIVSRFIINKRIMRLLSTHYHLILYTK